MGEVFLAGKNIIKCEDILVLTRRRQCECDCYGGLLYHFLLPNKKDYDIAGQKTVRSSLCLLSLGIGKGSGG